MSENGANGAKRATCPTCRGTAVRAGNKLFPFCSTRCHLIDLGCWLAEDYRVPGEPDPRALPDGE